eukprot:5790594-Prorocentrum_lima.AAC.1
MVTQARTIHDDWLELTPDQQAAIEGSFMCGDESPIPSIGNTLDNHSRVDILGTRSNTNQRFLKA